MQELKILHRMQSISFSDRNTSQIDGQPARISLVDIDTNSVSTRQDTLQCVDMHGQHTVGSLVEPRTISFTISFSGEYYQNGRIAGGGEAKMRETRRAIIQRLFLNENVLVQYTRDGETYSILARTSEIPVFNTIGSLCSAQIYMTADYPFWTKGFNPQPVTVTPSSSGLLIVENNGDFDCPLELRITCNQPITGASDNELFVIKEMPTDTPAITLVKSMNAREVLSINSGMDNETWVNIGDQSAVETPANNYVRHSYITPLTNFVGTNIWELEILGRSGSLTCEMYYKELYAGV
jgi:hypothetical protein